jgi:hypothetical protein
LREEVAHKFRRNTVTRTRIEEKLFQISRMIEFIDMKASFDDNGRGCALLHAETSKQG